MLGLLTKLGFCLQKKWWKHVVLRHPELENKLFLVLDVVASPDEVYIDQEGAFHALKRLHGEVSDYIVVIYLGKMRKAI